MRWLHRCYWTFCCGGNRRKSLRLIGPAQGQPSRCRRPSRFARHRDGPAGGTKTRNTHYRISRVPGLAAFEGEATTALVRRNDDATLPQTLGGKSILVCWGAHRSGGAPNLGQSWALKTSCPPADANIALCSFLLRGGTHVAGRQRRTPFGRTLACVNHLSSGSYKASPSLAPWSVGKTTRKNPKTELLEECLHASRKSRPNSHIRPAKRIFYLHHGLPFHDRPHSGKFGKSWNSRSWDLTCWTR